MSHPLREVVYRLADPRFVVDAAQRLFMTAWNSVSPGEFSRLYRRVHPYTMCSPARLRGLYEAVCRVTQDNVEGDIVECGCARGGSVALMALALQSLNQQRTVWGFDTFEGLPAPTSQDPDYEIAKLFTGDCVGSIEEVDRLLQDLQTGNPFRLVKGLFQDTLPASNIPQIALLHIDGDWYESVKVCLDQLYDKVSPGGVIQFDDYGYWQGANKAVNEFLKMRRIDLPLQSLDYSGRFLIKPRISAPGASQIETHLEANTEARAERTFPAAR